ncbi:MAG: hypothetical protein LWW95_03315 [Candidatus Desulfofervidus auxilii]|nr:hypothetical protein [Candidatus Desulfofervidus auxilii]
MLVNPTRITIPIISEKILHRERLIFLLKKGLEKKLITIVAGPGEGKTTLAIDFVNTLKLPTIWYSLTSSDSDLVRFINHLDYALCKTFQKYKQGTIAHYFSSITNISSQIDQLADVLAANFDKIVDDSLLIVLDDYHLIHSNSNVHFFLARLLEHCPKKIHFIIITRFPLHDVYAKFYLHQEILEITKDDLRFTLEETFLLFKKIFFSKLEKNKIKELTRICDGWIIALILLSKHLEKLDTESIPKKSLDKLYSYLGEEIFKKLPLTTQTVLLKTSILEEVTPELAQKLSGIPNAKDIIETFAKHYFLATRVAHDTYRYHHLLRLFLQSKLTQKEIKKLHLKAASYYQTKKNNFIAIHHILKANCLKKAARLLEKEGWNLLITGQYESLESILKNFSSEDFQNNPWLLYFKTWLDRWEKPKKAIQEFKKAINLFKQKKNNKGVVISILAYVEVALMAGNISLRLSKLIDQVAQIVEQKKVKFPSYLLPYILLSTASVRIFCNGNFQHGLELAETAYKSALKNENLYVQLKSLVLQGFAHYYMGEIENASNILKKLLNLIEKDIVPLDIRFYIFHLGGMIYRLKGDIKKAKIFLDKSLKIVKQLKAESLYPFIFETIITVHIIQREYFNAKQKILELKNIGEYTQNMWVLTLVQINLVCLYLLTKSKEVLNLIPYLLKIAKKAGREYFFILAKVLAIATYSEMGKKEKAIKLFKNTLLKAQKMKAKYLVCLLYSEAAKLYFDLGKKSLFIKYLQNFLELIKNNPYRYFYNYRENLYAFIAYQSINQGIYPEVGENIIIIFLGRNANKALSPYLKEARPEVKERLKKLIKKAFKHSAPLLFIKTLGDFEVKVGNKTIVQWESQKAKTLLKILVTRGEKPVPIDVIMEDLWPEANWESVKENFKITLKRLRRSLEPDLPSRISSSYICLKSNCLYLDSEKVIVDAWEFKRKAKSLQKKKMFTQDDLKEVESIIKIYKGIFLPQDLYNEWASGEREYLRNIYIKLLEIAVSLTKNLNLYKKTIFYLELLIAEDSFNQKLYEELMNCYLEIGLYNKAIELFKNFKKLFETELGIPPGKKMIELYQKALTLISH